MTADLIGKKMRKAIRWGYNGNRKILSELLHDADMKLFRSMLHIHHIFTSYSVKKLFKNLSLGNFMILMFQIPIFHILTAYRFCTLFCAV